METDQMQLNNLSITLFLITIMCYSTGFAQNSEDTYECLDKVLTIKLQIDSVSLEKVNSFFICLADTQNANNVELGQFGNEILFKLLEINPKLFFDALECVDKNTKEYIMEELKSPIHDGIEIDLIFTKISDMVKRKELDKSVLKLYKPIYKIQYEKIQ